MTLKEYIDLIEDEDETLALVGIQRAAETDQELIPEARQKVLTAVSYRARHLRALGELI